jgi:Tol biopolymer transport system component
MSTRPLPPRAALSAASLALLAACSDRSPVAPAAPTADPSAAIVVGPGVPCPTCPNPNKGKILFVRTVATRGVSNQEVFKADADGANPVRLTVSTDDDTDPAWSPDYTKIVFVRKTAGATDLFTMNADGSNVKRLTKTPAFNESQPSWMPDGGLVFLYANTTIIGSYNYKDYPQLAHIEAQAVANPNGVSGYGVWLPHLEGTQLFDPCDRTGPCFPLGHPSPVQHPHMAPNGREIAFVIWNPRAGRMGIRVMDRYGAYAPRWLYGAEPVLASPQGPPVPTHPRFSPEGAQLSFLIGGASGSEIRLVNPGDGSVEHLITPGKPLSHLSWSPDGQALVARDGTDGSLLRVDRASGATLTLAGTAPSASPSWAR